MTSLRKLGIFQLDLCRLISAGKKEQISKIADEIINLHLIEYLYGKYTDKDFTDLCFPYDRNILRPEVADTLNRFFDSVYSPGCEMKYCLYNEDDGLVFLLDLIAEKIKVECMNWKG